MVKLSNSKRSNRLNNRRRSKKQVFYSEKIIIQNKVKLAELNKVRV